MMLHSLPTGIAFEICRYLADDEPFDQKQVSILSILSKYAPFKDCARAVLWRRVRINLVQVTPNQQSFAQTIDELKSACHDAEHSFFVYTKRLHVAFGPLSMDLVGIESKAEDTFTLLKVMKFAKNLSHLVLDYRLCEYVPDGHTLVMNRMLSALGEEATAVSILNLKAICHIDTRKLRRLCFLKIQQSRVRIAIDFSAFRNLKCLNLDLSDEDQLFWSAGNAALPPQIWLTLKTFVIKLSGKPDYLDTVCRSIETSIVAAGVTSLERLGIFGMSFLPRHAMLLQAFRRYGASVKHLALATNNLPRPAWIALLADDFPNLVSLSLFGRNRIQDAFQWPAPPEEFGRALCFFQNLRVFEANAAWPTARDIVIHGWTAALCNAQTRFAQGLAQSCMTLSEIAFRPHLDVKDRFGVYSDFRRLVWPCPPDDRPPTWWE